MQLFKFMMEHLNVNLKIYKGYRLKNTLQRVIQLKKVLISTSHLKVMAELAAEMWTCTPENTERGFQQRKASQIYTERLSHKNKQTGSAETAQQLRAAAAQAENLALGLNTCMAVQTIHCSSYQGSDTLF